MIFQVVISPKVHPTSVIVVVEVKCGAIMSLNTLTLDIYTHKVEIAFCLIENVKPQNSNVLAVSHSIIVSYIEMHH